jgi:hypothetical protein
MLPRESMVRASWLFCGWQNKDDETLRRGEQNGC